MRRLAIAAISFLLAAGIIFSVFNIFYENTFTIPLLDLVSKGRSASADGEFVGQFKSNQDGCFICGIDGTVEDGILYVWVLGTKNKNNALPVDSDGYVTLEFDAEEPITKVFYRNGDTRQLLNNAE